MARLRKELLNLPKRKNVETCPEDASRRLVLLSSAVRDPLRLEGLSAEGKKFLESDDDLLASRYTVKVDYSYFGADEVLRQVLGPMVGDQEIVTSFETVGHIAHLNLREFLLPYKKVIAQVIMDKNSRITTVVNKVGTIATEFRTFPMEVLAGEPNFEVEVRESGSTFRFNFAKVYWNSRLQQEHTRLIDIITDGGGTSSPNIVCDMMAGVGPFAVPLARRGHRVFANDLNPDSYEALKENATRNKCQGMLTSSNLCAREFIRGIIGRGQVFHHAILNLPNSALEFLDVFADVDWEDRGFPYPPTIHVYCFSKAEDPMQDALQRTNSVMGSDLSRKDVKIHFVRDVAPKKPMLCLSFRAPDGKSQIASESRVMDVVKNDNMGADADSGKSGPACVGNQMGGNVSQATEGEMTSKRQRIGDGIMPST